MSKFIPVSLVSSLCLDTVLQEMTEIILIKTENKFSKFVDKETITNCSATADCIHVDVHVSGIGKEETYKLAFIITLS